MKKISNFEVLMSRIEKVDKNLAVKTKIEKEGIIWRDAQSEVFLIYGVFFENGMFRRIPENIAKSVSEGVEYLHANTAGGRIEFITDSPYVAINVEYGNIAKLPHFALTGSAGIDMYISNESGKKEFYGTFVPPYKVEDHFEGILEFNNKEIRHITLNLPLYSEVKAIYIGLDNQSVVNKSKKYQNENPVVFYGSSITQGGCASRPGMAYPSIVCRKLDLDYINLGFSGSAKGEKEIAEYISNLDMSIFVYDYDHNAPSCEHLKATHEPMFKMIREKHPDLPVIFMSATTMPRFTDGTKKRKEIILQTYLNAKANGDNNVYFIDGSEIRAEYDNEGAVEGAHPTDLGFHFMANKVADVIGNIIK